MPDEGISGKDPDLIKMIFADIDERNSTVKKSDAWLRSAYASIGIQKLNDIPPSDYASYRRFVDNGEVYIIVHPGYFPFFDTWDIPRPMTDYQAGFPAQNAMERITAGIPRERRAFRAAREQELILRDFLEYTSYDKKLVILIVPRDHLDHVTYGQTAGYDEYARYINEMTNRAVNIVYLESIAFDRGNLVPEDLSLLLRFLKETGAGTVLLGGGFMGRCLDNFYGSLKNVMFASNINHVLELTEFSPTNMARDKVDLLTESGHISQKKALDYFNTYAYNSETEEWLAWRPFSLYKVYENR